MKKVRKVLKWLGIVVATPILLFLVLAILLYIPPIQNFVVRQVTDALSRSLDMTIRIEKVRLAFPLDLSLHNTLAVEGPDTLLDARRLRLNVELLPLFRGRANIDGVELYDVKLNTKDLIPDVGIKGHAGTLTAASRGIEWKREWVRLNRVRLADADFDVVLADTAKPDTTPSTSRWRIMVDKADIARSRVRLRMPGDSMRITADMPAVALRTGDFDTGRGRYAVKRLTLHDVTLNYDIPYLVSTRGLDPNHIAVSGLTARIDTFCYDEKQGLSGRLQALRLKEKCGLEVRKLSGSFAMDSTHLTLPDLNLHTPYSSVLVQASLDLRTLAGKAGGACDLQLDASLGSHDILALAGNVLPAPVRRALPGHPLILKAKAYGTTREAVIRSLRAGWNGIATAEASGRIRQPLSAQRSGTMRFHLRTERLEVVRKLLPADLLKTIQVPDRMSADGEATFHGDRYTTRLTLRKGRGTIKLNAQTDIGRETYRAALHASAFPLHHFLRGIPLSPFTGQLTATGSGYDPTQPRATLSAKAGIDSLVYDKYNLSGFKFDARLHRGTGTVAFDLANDLLTTQGMLDLHLSHRGYDVGLSATVPSIDLRRIGAVKDTLSMGTDINIRAHADRRFTRYSVEGGLSHNRFTTPKMSAMAKDVLFDFGTSPDTTTAHLSAGDLTLKLGSKGDIPRLTKQLTRFTDELTKQVQRKSLDQETLKRLLPIMTFYLEAGKANPLYNIARMKQYSFDTTYVHLNTDPRHGMTGHVKMRALNTGTLLLDSIDSYIIQDTTGVNMYARVKNGAHNDTPMEVLLKSYLRATSGGVEFLFRDSKGREGVRLGLEAALAPGGLQLHLYPEEPILAYRHFTVNKDNYIYLGKDKQIRANVDLLADDGTGIKLYGEPKDSLNDLTVSVKQVNLGELSTVLPYLPKLGGMLDGDIHITDNAAHTNLSAMASFEASSFSYEGTPLGDIGLEAIYLPKTGGEHHASAFVSAGGEEVLACNGTYYSSGNTPHFEGDAQLHDFPLQLLNGFLTGTDVALQGKAGGDLQVSGTMDKPRLNGKLDLDSAHIYSEVYGFDFRTDERAVEIHDSRLIFDNYNLYSTGKNPLVLNGTFDMSDFAKMQMDFTMRANDFELINTRKKARSMVYGKVYANYIGTLKGTPNDLSIRGKIEVLNRTDVTYILKDSPLSVDDRLSDLVEFVSFADTTSKKEARPVANSNFDLTLGISISDAAQFHCNLSEDGQSYVNLEGGGDLTMRMTQQGDMRMTGRFTVNSGRMKYALPVIPLKTFNIVEGSYVEFTGDIMNPTLNIQAKERTKAVVTENDKQRSVAFDVGVSITKPLNEMGLTFTIEAPEDLSIQNQLTAMSEAQRNKAAVALMATGMYMTDETMLSGGSGFKANNALNAFLQSEIQQIAGSALKTIDINLGVENSTTETGASTTDYSFQFAKRFWGNRISVIIGGKVSTGAEAQNSAESFINNVSVEYRLDQSATRYVKVFYDRNTQDPLEGQLTKTGAGLVLRRKTDRLGELFIFRKKKAPSPAIPATTSHP